MESSGLGDNQQREKNPVFSIYNKNLNVIIRVYPTKLALDGGMFLAILLRGLGFGLGPAQGATQAPTQGADQYNQAQHIGKDSRNDKQQAREPHSHILQQ